jgi:ABC-type multidrug transport system fused ATPase/permease subunit
MIKKLAKSIREYKKESILSALFITVEVIMEVLIPLVMAYLIDDGIKAANEDVVWKSSMILIVIATISLISGILSRIILFLFVILFFVELLLLLFHISIDSPLFLSNK